MLQKIKIEKTLHTKKNTSCRAVHILITLHTDIWCELVHQWGGKAFKKLFVHLGYVSKKSLKNKGKKKEKKQLVKYPPLERSNVTFSAVFVNRPSVRLTAGLAKNVLGMKGCERGEKAG